MASLKDEERSVIGPICILKFLARLSVSHMFCASRVTYLSSRLPPSWNAEGIDQTFAIFAANIFLKKLFPF